MAPHLLLRGRMSIRRAPRIAVPLLLLASCSGLEFEPGSGPGHHHFAPQSPPVLDSKPLDYQRHTPFDRRELPPPPVVAGPRRIAQKVLLLTADTEQPSYLAARDALVRIGIPFEELNAATHEVTPALLMDLKTSTCHFSGVLFSTSGLGYFDAQQGWISALSNEEWQRIASFQLACDAREAVWYAWPSEDLGLTFVSAFTSDDTVQAEVANPSFFKRVPATAQIKYQYAAGYRAAIADGASTTPLVTDSTGNVLVATHTRPDGSEVLVSTVDSSPYLPHALALEYDMLRWLTRGLFVGQKQTYFAPQIDDLFLSNDMWRLDLHANPEDDTHTFRISGTDLLDVATWQSSMQARLPAGSQFYTIMAYNGLGTTPDYSSDTSLLAAAHATGSAFQWLNHTWAHTNMDAMTREQARLEVAENCAIGQSLGLVGLACDELVTPDRSGLANEAADLGLVAAGIGYVVSDTSHAASDHRFADNPGDNPSFNVGRISRYDSRLYQIPRHPTNVFYDVMNPVELVDSYNVRFPGSATYEEILDLNSGYPLLYLLWGDVDPLMFHQANLATYDGAGNSLYSDFVEALMAKYLSISSAPVITLTQREIGDVMKQRAALDACNVRATIVDSPEGRTLEVRGRDACLVPVTGVAAPQAGNVETYAGETITSIAIPPGGGKVTIPL